MTRSQAIARAITALRTVPGSTMRPPMLEELIAILQVWGLLRLEAEPVPTRLESDAADILARVTLGAVPPARGGWTVGAGPDGADRIIEALRRNGYRIVRGDT